MHAVIGSDWRLTAELHHRHHHQTTMQPQVNLPLLSNGGLRTRGLCTRRVDLESVTSCDATETRGTFVMDTQGGGAFKASSYAKGANAKEPLATGAAVGLFTW